MAENEKQLTPEAAERIRQKANELLSRQTTPEEDAEDILAAFLECRKQNKELREIIVELRDALAKTVLLIPSRGSA